MSWLDNLISWLSPARGIQRMLAKQTLEELQKNYDAGSFGRVNNAWNVFNDSGEMTDRNYRDTVRARARDLERNSDIMQSVVRAYKRNTIGTGYRLQAKTDNESLNADIERLWKRWCRARNCDVTGMQSLSQLMRMAVERKKVDGGILFVKRYTEGGMLPFKIQMLEVDELAADVVKPRNPEARVIGGIELNSYNRPLGYWIRQYSLDGFVLTEPVYIDEKDVIFYHSKTRPSQIREMSDMSPTVTRIRDCNEFMTAVSVKERVEACLAVFIKRTTPTLNGIPYRQNGGGDSRESYEGKTLVPGMIKELNAGEEIQVVNPSGQSQDAASYIKLQQRMIAAGQGLSYEASSRDMSQSNYSSARQGSIEDELTYLEEEEEILAVLDEIYETFIISCELAGLLRMPGFWADKDSYFEHEWNRAPKKWIDPQKESNATKTALQTGIKTYKQIAAEVGRDWKSQLDDMAEVKAYAESIGLDIDQILYGKTGGEEVNAEDDTGSGLNPDDEPAEAE